MSMDGPSTQQGGEVRTTILKCMICIRVQTLKTISQQPYALFISLQDVEKVCNKALAWLSPNFNFWGPYTQLLERLIMLMAKKLDLLDKIITVKEILEIVK